MTAQPHALICDDQQKLRELLTQALAQRGITHVDHAVDGSDALEQLRTGHPDIVVLDVNMPGLTGLELLPHVRALTPNAAVIVITGVADDTIRDEALAAGADTFLPKRAGLATIADAIVATWQTRHPEHAEHPEHPDRPEHGGTGNASVG